MLKSHNNINIYSSIILELEERKIAHFIHTFYCKYFEIKNYQK